MGEDSDKVFEEAGADDILDLVRRLQEQSRTAEGKEQADNHISLGKISEKKHKKKEEPLVVDITKLFVFDELDEVNRLARVLKGFYNGCNVLYKNKLNRKYYLVISKSHHTPEEFNKVCNILSEYAHQEKYSTAIRAYFDEHYELILKEDALQILSKI